jgi:hypothetical protein
MSTKFLNPFPSDLRGEQRPKAIPPKPHSLMTDFDPALMQQILHIPERQREPDVQHHRRADDVGTGLEIPKWAVFDHAEKLNRHPALHNRVSSDRTVRGHAPRIAPIKPLPMPSSALIGLTSGAIEAMVNPKQK